MPRIAGVRLRTSCRPWRARQVHDEQADGAEHQRPLQVEGAVGEAAVAAGPGWSSWPRRPSPRRARAGRGSRSAACCTRSRRRCRGRAASPSCLALRPWPVSRSGRGRSGKALTRSPSTISRKRSPRALEVLEGVEAGAGGREQHGLAGGGRGGGAARRRPRGPSQRCRATPAAEQRRQLLGHAVGAWRRSGSRRRSARAPGRAAARRARPSRCRRGSRGRRPSKARMPDRRRGDVGRLGVVDEADAIDLGDRLEPVRDAGEAAQPVAHRLAVEPIESAAAAAAIALATLCSPNRPSSAASHQRLAVVEDRALGQGHLAVGRGADAEGDAAGAAAEVGAGQLPGRRRCRRRGRRCPGWRRSAASPPGRPRGRGGGRGGRGRG